MAEEKAFEKKVKEFLKLSDCWTLKTWSNGIQRSGVPDLLVCCDGLFIGIELKAKNGKPSPLQIWNLEKIEESGGIGILLYPEDFDAFKCMITDINNGFEKDATKYYKLLRSKLISIKERMIENGDIV